MSKHLDLLSPYPTSRIAFLHPAFLTRTAPKEDFVTSLKETWQAQRQHRQQEMLHRQQQVRTTLEQFSQARQMQANDLRYELQTFQHQLQQDTQSLIADLSAQRQIEATLLMQRLQAFTRSLNEEVANSLALTASDRAAMAQELWQSLDDFHLNLNATVFALRQDIREQIETLQAETQLLLESSYQARQQNHMQIQQMLQQDSEQRNAELNRLYTQLAELRSERMAFCAKLREQVWGTSMPIVQTATKTNSAKSSQPPKLKAIPQTRVSQARVSPAKISQTRLQPAAKGNSSVAVTAPAPIAPARIALPVQPKLSPLEQTIFDHLQRVQKATLVEIQSKFGINRFAAVDALRALIKKGCITQRDNTYIVQ
ncbi:hypothetical protein [Leptolyngbya ohadii]|uniref:hypothetical protein n=1 Tax=Leptolyngbya ohadii TaxID=1962290 RepID=UPI000B5A1663|nr:hypothetical protein [Leptolyngbya ohadii]